jgi:hypothetical protein
MLRHPTSFRSAVACLALAALGLAACGGDDDDNAQANTSDAESAYCNTAREWLVYALTQYDPSDPAALEQYMDEYVAFHREAAEQAPASIDDDWALNRSSVEEQLIPVFEKYGYSIQRIEAEATPEEQATAMEPPPDVQAAQERIHAYEREVCAAGLPVAADVEFEGPADEEYCAAVLADSDMANQVALTEPDAVRAELTSPEFAERQQKLLDTAPDEIRDDVATFRTFVTEQQTPLIEKYGYDIPKVLLHGTQHEREVLNYGTSDVKDAYARIIAYEEQLCGVEEEA